MLRDKMSFSALLLFLLASEITASPDLCKLNISGMTFPLQASCIQNLSPQDPFYFFQCFYYLCPEWLKFICLFNVPLYDCSVTTKPAITTTTTPATTTTTTTATTTTTTPAMTTTTTPIDPCKARRTGVNITGIGNLLVGPNKLTFNQSVEYCTNITGCKLWIPQANSSVLHPLIYDITYSCDSPATPEVKGLIPLDMNNLTVTEFDNYFIGVFNSPGISTDINGQPWDFLTNLDLVSRNQALILALGDKIIYSDENFFSHLYSICQCR